VSPRPCPPAADLVDVWIVPLDPPEDALLRHAGALSEDERTRAARYARPRDRRRSLAARAALRALLSVYVTGPPASLQLVRDELGKPRLADDGVAFNLSHDGDLALVAIARRQPVGIDLEHVEHVQHLDELAAACLTPRERAWLEGRPPARRPRAFAACWVAKEATLKALGVGLARSPLLVEVEDADERPVVRTARGERIAVTTLDVGPERTAALAVVGDTLAVSQRTFGW
jgi:4'-phosphopantetheinyl transferase